ncbi:H/ACA RNA-protein complex protein Gar1 [Sulfolobales archaeon HS-7]|nr:H/ACA RNA-protein complex protein Gar1 [Sulfolobales archaeon HS-7]
MMAKSRLTQLGYVYNSLPRYKVLVKGINKMDYTKYKLVGKYIFDEKKRKVGQVLDVVGNVNEPYILVKSLEEIKKGEKVFFEERRR